VLAYAKNQALGFEIPYLDSGITRRYLPDFLVRLNDGGEEPLNLELEEGHQGRERQGQGLDDTRTLGPDVTPNVHPGVTGIWRVL
jgi:hypothetical protein